MWCERQGFQIICKNYLAFLLQILGNLDKWDAPINVNVGGFCKGVHFVAVGVLLQRQHLVKINSVHTIEIVTKSYGDQLR